MTEITNRRTLEVKRATGTVNWQAFEVDDGRAYTLTADAAGIQFSAHFNREQWASFAAMVAGEQS